MIRLQFVGAGDLGSDAIKWFTQGEVSHVDIVLSDGRLLGSRDDIINGIKKGVQIRPPGYANWKIVVPVSLPCPQDMEKNFYQFAMAEIGKPYDEMGIAAFVFGSIIGRDWRDDSAWFCSEYVGAMLEKCGYFATPLATPTNKLAPSGLLLACSARVSVVM